ncbi:Uncharacterised protein [Enterobacter cloacae]|nr:Uncharacterised protein [Enterobacter cloacae]
MIKLVRCDHRIAFSQLLRLGRLFFFLQQISHQAYLILTNIFHVGIRFMPARIAVRQLLVPLFLAKQRQALFYI